MPGPITTYLTCRRARGLDTFIGDPGKIGAGHGPAYLKLLISKLRAAGTPALGIDPHPDNERAIKVYAKLGFKADCEVESEWGRALLMSLRWARQPTL